MKLTPFVSVISINVTIDVVKGTNIDKTQDIMQRPMENQGITTSIFL